MHITTGFLHVPNKFLNISNVIVEMKWAVLERHFARIFPIGNRHIVIGQHGAYGIAQQRRIMTRQWCKNQNPRFIFY